MSTRAQIKVDGIDNVYVYKHSDGYPDGEHGVLAWLVPYVTKFLNNRGWDDEFLLARIMYEGMKIDEAAQAEYRSSNNSKLNTRLNAIYDFTGWGIGPEIHGDTEYLYVVKEDSIEVQHCYEDKTDKIVLELEE